jgi:FkbM family methyltransferase
MKRSIGMRLRRRLAHVVGPEYPLRAVHVMGREVRLREGHFGAAPDYDDAWLVACAFHSPVMFDVGANMGHAALLALLTGSVQQVVLVDPNAAALSVAAEALILNGLAQGARFVTAFADERPDESQEFWTVGTGAAGSMYRSHAHSAARAGSRQVVPTTSIDHLCRVFDLAPDFVKLDIEGAEARALAGARECAGKQQTRFLVEMHSNPDLSMVENTTRVLTWCESVGYAAWYLAYGERLENAERVARRGRCHFLLQPAAWSYPEWLAGLGQGASLEEAVAASRGSLPTGGAPAT